MIKNIIMNILIPVIAIGGVGMAIYSSMMEYERVTENMRIADSLRAEVNKYHQKYDSLLVIAAQLDAKVAEGERRLDSLKKHPPTPKPPKPPKQTPNEALEFLKEFIED
jgi:ribosomal protein S13